jgi:DDE_Tnp_1-associated
MNLLEHLQQVPDFRTQPRYPLWVILVLIILGTMSGCSGYRALEDFVKRHQKALLAQMNLPHCRLPSYSTLRKAMVRVNFESFTQSFNNWAAQTFAVSVEEQIPVDGKSIKVTVQDYDQSYQDFISTVSAFSTKQGVVVALESMHNRGGSEIVTVQKLLEALNLKGVCFSMDAVHTQKNCSADYRQWQ